MNTRCGSERSLTKELVLLAGQRDALAAHVHAPGRPVDDETLRVQPLGRRRPRAAEDCANAGDQLAVVEGLGDEVVAATGEGAHAVERVGSLSPSRITGRLRFQGGRARPRAAGGRSRYRAGRAARRRAGGLGAFALHDLERLRAGVRVQDVEAVVGQVAVEEAARRRLGLGE